MIQLAAAGFLLGALGLAVPIILHFMRQRPLEARPFPSFRFLHQTLASRQNRNHLRKWIVLALRCLALLLLALAFSWPYLRGFAAAPTRATIVLWDNSCSMQAAPVAGSLRSSMLSRINGASETAPVLLGVIEDDGIRWSGKFSPDRAALRDWFATHSDGNGTSAFDPPLRLADARLRAMNAAQRSLCLITDGLSQPWKDVQFQKSLSPGIQLDVVLPPRSGFQNVAVTQARFVEPLVRTGQPLTLEITLRNYHNEDAGATPVITFGGTERTLTRVTIPARNSVALSATLTAGPVLEPHFGEVRLVTDDELAPDNTRHFCANPSQRPQLLATRQPGPDDFVRLALTLGDDPAGPAFAELDAGTTDAALAATDALLIRTGISPRMELFPRVDGYLRKGGRMVVTWDDSLEMRQFLKHYGIEASPLGSGEARTLDTVDFEHPLFRRFSQVRVAALFGVLFFGSPQLTLPAEARTIATFSDGSPAIAELAVEQGRLIVVASSMARTATDWPGSATFLPFWREMTSYCRARDSRPDAVEVSLRPLPVEGITRITRVGGAAQDVTPGTPFIPDTAGAYLLTTAAGNLGVCVNVPARESEPDALPDTFEPGSLVSKVPAPAIRGAAKGDEYQKTTYWRVVLAAALIFMFSELLLANRTAL